MTPETQTQTETTVQQPPNMVVAYITTWLFSLALLTPLVALAWNMGIQGAGIVSHGIDWSTALGLAITVLILRTIAAGARPSMFMMR